MPKSIVALALSVLAGVAVVGPNQAFAQNPVGAAGAQFVTCAEAAPLDGRLSYARLLTAAAVCEQEGRPVDATYFLIVSQIRIAVDAELLFPRDGAAQMTLERHQAFHFERAGGSGHDHVYRDTQTRDALMTRLRAWHGAIAPGYDPGWAFKRLPEPSDVEETVERARHNRLEKLRYYAALIANDEYFDITRRMDELSRETGGVYLPHMPSFHVFNGLREARLRIERQLAVPLPDLREPKTVRVDPEPDFRQLHTGTNGPDNTGYAVLARREQVAEAFASVLSPPDLARLLAEVDFSTEVVVVITAGRHQNATGKLIVARLDVASRGEKWTASYRLAVGVMREDCTNAPAPSRPFVILAKRRPDERASGAVSSRTTIRFADGCIQSLGDVTRL